MAFTAAEIANSGASALDFYYNKGTVYKQSIQNKPLLDFLESSKQTFPSGKGDISIGVKGAFGAGGVNDGVKGFTHNDTVNYYNPTNTQRAAYPWRELHIGISCTYTELKIDGISVSDDARPADSMSRHSKRELTALANIWDEKLFDMGERYAQTMNGQMWGDGTADAKGLAGMRSILSADPSVGTVGGIDRAVAAAAWWRNRARTAAFAAKVTATPALAVHGGGAVTANAANGGALLTELQKEFRQLRRYGGNPKKFFAGSDFIGAMEMEIRANGNYSQTGFTGRQDGSMGKLYWDGIEVVYDPTLDDLGLAKRAYIWDPTHIFLMAMDQEWGVTHSPPRPSDAYLLYKSMTYTGQIVARQCNAALVIDIT